MAVPKKKKSHARTAMRRSQWKLAAPTLVRCPHCRAMRKPHHVCPSCGYYDGHEVVKIEAAE